MDGATQDRQRTPLAARRKERGLTQVALASQVGCSQRQISDIELGDANPSLDLARAIARVLGATLDDLFGEAVTS